MEYLRLFETAAEYEAAQSNLILPNVSLIEETEEVEYNPYVEPVETRLVCKYNITSPNSYQTLWYYTGTNIFKYIEIDGDEVSSATTGYTFDTVGIHTVKYELVDETFLGQSNDAPIFYNNYALVDVFIPNTITSIGKNVFINCSGLTRLNSDVDGVFNIPNSVTSIGNSAFVQCSSLTSINIPSGVTSIGSNGNNILAGCSGLTSITVDSNNAYYDSRNNCNAIINTSTNELVSGCKNTVIPNGVTSIGANAFAECTRLTSIDIPNSVTSIGANAFAECTRLTSIDIPNSVTSIDYGAFQSCSGLTSIDIPNSVTSIGNSAFTYCSGMTTCTIGSGVTSIGTYAFRYCSGLTSITMEGTTPPTLSNGNAFSNTNNCPIYVPTCSLVNTYKSASGWGTYGSRITALDCPPIVAKFNVTSTTNATRIASATTAFSSVEIDGVEQPSVTTGYTFGTMGEHTVKYTLKNPSSFGNSAFTNCYRLESITIPDSVTSIGTSAFQYCRILTSCTIGSGVTTIGNSAFQECSNLANIVIPDNVTSIGHNAFSSCFVLSSITIPDSVTSIGNNAFSSCRLTSVNIPSGITSIGNNAFSGCSRTLSSITVDSNNTVYDSRNNCNAIIKTSTNELIIGCKNTVIPNDVASINSTAFAQCSGLTSITIPSSVTSIGNSAFYQCSGLTSIVIPNSVTSIGNDAFETCSAMTNCTIGSGVTSIGEHAFCYCYELKTITSNAATAPTIQNRTFQSVGSNGTLYVPNGSSGYDTWMQNIEGFLGYENWTKVVQ